jgi:Na+-driven multidrug efflux pump
MFEYTPIPAAVMTLAVPPIITQLINIIYNFADTWYVGRTGNAAMVAALSVCMPVFVLLAAVANLFGIGGASVISRALGRKDPHHARKAFAFCFYAGLAASLVYAAVILLLRARLIPVIGGDDASYPYIYDYMFWTMIIGAVPTVGNVLCGHLVRSVGAAKEAGFGMSMGGVLNIILDPLFMFVILPKGNEILGAGIATMLSNVVTLVFFLITIRRIQKSTVLSLSLRRGMPCRTSIRSVFVNGTPGGISNLLFNFSQVTINRLMSGYGDIPLAGIGIVLKAERIPLNTGVGICQGIIPIVAYNYAAGNHDRMNETIRFSRRLGLGVAAVSIMMYELFAGPIMGMFIPEAETVRIGAGFLRARCLATPFMFMAFHILFSIQAMGEGKVAMALAVIRQLILYIPLLFIMNALFGMYGLVWAQLIGDAVTDIISYLWFFRILKKDKYDNLG